ncbi:MAG: hypothetical protein HPY64_00770 [Anaerolineae bacterium]|nr:hypothetical protein [Anaerolineae bacterium]
MLTLPPHLADQLPDALHQTQQVVARLTRQLELFGYLPVNTPLVEQADVFLIKAGDAAINRLVSFELNGQTLCLRPEFTAPAARVYIERFQDHPGPVRLQFAGPILQYDSLSHGAITEQNAIGAELINEYSPAADAEVIALTIRLVEEAGVKDWQVTVGHSGMIERFLDRYQLNRQMRRFVINHLSTLRQGAEGLAQALEALANLETPAAVLTETQPINNHLEAEAALYALLQATPQHGPSGGRNREEIARRLLEKQQQGNQRDRVRHALRDLQQLLEHVVAPAALLAHLEDDTLQVMAQHILATFSLLAAYGIPQDRIAFDLSFTRNLDYYTGLIFECHAGQVPGRLFGGGGRYDELIGLLGARHSVPAVGFMLYLNPLLNAQQPALLEEPRDRIHVLVRPSEDQLTGEAIALASALRAADIQVTTQSSFSAARREPHSETHLLTVEQSGLRLSQLADHTEITLDHGDIAGVLRALELRS